MPEMNLHLERTEVVLNELATLLSDIANSAGRGFVGTGLIVSDHPEELPIFPICIDHALDLPASTSAALAAISRSSHPFHDGFHVIANNFAILRLSQYFATPILENAAVDRSKRFGGRYLAAMFGSALPTVTFVGIASPGFGRAIFKNGREIFYEVDRA